MTVYNWIIFNDNILAYAHDIIIFIFLTMKIIINQ